MKTIKIIGGVFAVLVAVPIACGIYQGVTQSGKGQAPSSEQNRSPQGNETASDGQESKKSDWEYSSFVTNAGTKTVRVGCVASINDVHLGSPYSDTGADLCIRSTGDTSVSLHAEGQILSGFDHTALVRIDNGKPFRVGTESPSDGSSKTAFLDSSKAIIGAARSGKRIAIEFEYFQAGTQTLTFIPSTAIHPALQ